MTLNSQENHKGLKLLHVSSAVRAKVVETSEEQVGHKRNKRSETEPVIKNALDFARVRKIANMSVFLRVGLESGPKQTNPHVVVWHG